MGCRCCKMIQSYLFDPVQVASPGYVNEVNSCKLDEEDPVKLKGKQIGEVLAHKSDLQSEDLKRTLSRSRTAGPQGPCWPHQGPHYAGDTGGGPCAEKTGSAVNGIGPAVGLQPAGDPGPHRGGTGSEAGTANSTPPTQPCLEGPDARGPDCAPPASEETRVVGNGDSGVPSQTQCAGVEVQNHVLQIPAPDYPVDSGSAADGADPERKAGVSGRRPEAGEEPREEVRPGAAGRGSDLPFAGKRWGSLAAGPSARSKGDSSQAVRAAGSGNTGGEDARGHAGGRGVEDEDEDPAVAEALAALEAATAGEDVDAAD